MVGRLLLTAIAGVVAIALTLAHRAEGCVRERSVVVTAVLTLSQRPSSPRSSSTRAPSRRAAVAATVAVVGVRARRAGLDSVLRIGER